MNLLQRLFRRKIKYGSDIERMLAEAPEDAPDARYTYCMLSHALREGITHREISTTHPLVPLPFSGNLLQPVPIHDVVRLLKKQCNYQSTTSKPMFFRFVNNMGPRHRVTCTFHDNSDDFATIAITPDPEK